MPNPATEYTVRSYFQRIDTGQLPLLAQFAAPDYRLHFTGIPDPLNLEGATGLIAGFRAAFPDLRHDIERIAEFWSKDDDASLLMQLGMLPPPQGA